MDVEDSDCQDEKSNNFLLFYQPVIIISFMIILKSIKMSSDL